MTPQATEAYADAKPARYCYSCKRFHPPERLMRRVLTRAGHRWRCQDSIDAARQHPSLRDAWGREKSAQNRLSAQMTIEAMNQQRLARFRG